MLFRAVFVSASALGAAACLVAPSLAAGLPKERTCKFKVSVEGKQDATIIGAARTDGVASWSESQKTIETCEGWPAMQRRCFGLSEMNRGAESAYGFCVATDADGDSIVWKLLPHSVDASQDRIPEEALMASGKYAGMTGKSTSRCAFSGSAAEYVGTCDVEMTYKTP